MLWLLPEDDVFDGLGLLDGDGSVGGKNFSALHQLQQIASVPEVLKVQVAIVKSPGDLARSAVGGLVETGYSNGRLVNWNRPSDSVCRDERLWPSAADMRTLMPETGSVPQTTRPETE